MKRSALNLRCHFALLVPCFAALASVARAVPYYWDTNAATAGSGSANGTWGAGSMLWSTDSTGATATGAVTTTSADDLFFSAGTNGTGGTVTVSGTQIAHSLTFDDPVNLTVSGGTITLGSGVAGSGIFFTAPSGTNVISSALSLAGTTTLANSGTGIQVLSGVISGAQAINVNSTGSGAIILSGTNTYAGGLTLIAGTLNLNNAAAAGAASGSLSLNGGTLDVTTPGVIGLNNNPQSWGGNFTFGGTRNLNLGTGNVTLTGNRTVTVNANTGMAARSNNNGLLTAGGVVSGAFSLTKNGAGTLQLSSAANTFNGGINLQGGALRVTALTGTLVNNNIALDGGVLELGVAPAGPFTLGTAPSQVNFVGDGGFSASGGARSVTLAGSGLVWGTTANFVGNGRSLNFGSLTSDSTLTLTNDLDLGAAARTVNVTRGTGAGTPDGILAGVLTNGSLTKTGTGSLTLSNAGTTLSGTTTIAGGTLTFANQTTAIANTNVVLDGGVLGLPSADFTAALGAGNGQVRFAGGTAAGGFAAIGGNRTVNIGGAGATLTWNSTPDFLGSGALILGSNASSNTTIFANGLDFNGADRTIQVEDGNTPDDARIDGIISGAGGLLKTGGGVGGGGRLILGSANTYTGSTVLRQGELVINNSVLSGTAGPLGNSTSAIVIGDSGTLSGNDNNSTPLYLRVRALNSAPGDGQNIIINRGIDFTQSPNAAFTNNAITGFTLGRYRISLDGNGGSGTDGTRLTLSGPVSLGAANNRPVEIFTERAGQTVEFTGNITGISGAMYLQANSNGNSSATDGRAGGSFRFSDLARPFANQVNLTVGKMLIEGSVGAAGADSPIGRTVVSLGDGNGGNTLFSNGRDSIRAILMESAGSTYNRILSPGAGSGATPGNAVLYGTGSTGLINGYQFGGVNSSGTVTFAQPVTPGNVNVSVSGTAGYSGGTNAIKEVHNIALMAAGGGTVEFAGAISGATAPVLAPGTASANVASGNNTRITINQFRNHANLDGNQDGTADPGIANALTGTATTGTVVLSGTNTYGGSTEILGGTLRLNYATNNTNKLADGAAFLLSGGTVELAGGSHVEVTGSAAVGAGTANRLIRSAGTSTLRLNSLTRNAGGVLDIAAGGLADTDTLNTNGIIGGWAIIAGSDFAANSTNALDGSITAYGAYTDVTRLTPGTIADAPASNVRIVEGAGSAGNITLGAAITTIHSLNQSTSGGSSASVIDPAGQTLRTGAILAGTGSGGLTIGAGTNNGTLSAATSGGELIVQNFSSNDLTLNSTVADNTTASSLTVGGTGRTILTAANSFTGATVVSSGTLNVRDATALGGTTAGTTVSNGATLELEGGILTGAESVTLAGQGIANGGALRNVIGNNTWGGAITLTADSRIQSEAGTLTLNSASAIGLPTIASSAYQLTIGGSGNLNIASVLSLSDPANGYLGSLVKDGSGTALLTRANTYLGSTTILGGTLQLGDNVTGTDGSLASPSILNNGSLLYRNFASQTYSGVISGSGSVTKNSTGALTLSGPNSYDGITTITAGTLAVSQPTGLGSTVGGTVINSNGTVTTGGQLSLNGGITVAENITIQGPGDGLNFQRAISSSAGNNTISGTITVTGTTTYRLGANSGTVLNLGLIQRSTAAGGGLTFDPSVGGTVNINIPLDNNMGTLTAHAGGLVALNATGNDIGSATVQNGTTLLVGAVDALNTSANLIIGQGNVVNVATGVNNDVGTLILAGVNQTISALNAFPNGGGLPNNATASNNRKITNNQPSTLATLTIGNNNGSGTFDGLIEDGAGQVAILKTGTGTQTFTGTVPHTYTGTTTIQGGRLNVNNTINGGTLTVQMGAVLGGTGVIDSGTPGSTLEVSGTVAPGLSPGILTSNKPVAFNAGSLFQAEINGSTTGTGYDQLIAGNGISLASTSVISLTLGYDPAPTDIFTLISNLGTGPIIGTFSNLPDGGTLNATFGGNTYAFSANYSGGSGNDLVLSVVPEASTSLLALLSTALLAGRRRRSA